MTLKLSLLTSEAIKSASVSPPPRQYPYTEKKFIMPFSRKRRRRITKLSRRQRAPRKSFTKAVKALYLTFLEIKKGRFEAAFFVFAFLILQLEIFIFVWFFCRGHQ